MSSKKKKKPTIDEVRTLREQAEGHIFEVVRELEDITGITVTGISISRKRPAGFLAKPYMEINIQTDSL